VIVVDTSIWVDYFNGQVTPETDALDNLLGRQEIIVGDLILTEVLQGFRQERHFRQVLRLFRAFPIVTMLGPDLAVRSAENYRVLRRRGVTVRKTIDVMIGTYCLVKSYPLLFADRDFDPMVQHLGLISAG
jgi:hypothetical protein